MEDLDIIIYTSMMLVLFIILGVNTFGEFRRMEGKNYTGTERTDDTKLLKSFLIKLFG